MNPSRKRFAVGVLGTMAFLTVRVDAVALSPEDLLLSCQAITAQSPRSAQRMLDIPAEGLPCWYYMEAVQNMTALSDKRGERFLGICPPPDSTVLDFVRIFVQRARPEDVGSHRNAAAFVLLRLAQAFPC